MENQEQTLKEEVEETFEPVKIVFPVKANLESCKIKFFNKDYENFKEDVKSNKYTIYSAEYNYMDEFNGKPKFIINNLLNGFTQQLENKRKYLFVVFKCFEMDNKLYKLTSTWITNVTVNLKEVIPDKYDDFNWNQINNDDVPSVDNYIKQFENFEEENQVAISYLH